MEILLLLLAICPGDARSRTDRVNLFPRLRPRQTIHYQISFRSEKETKTQSSVLMTQAPPAARTDARGLLLLEILGVETQGERAIIHARTRFESLNPGPAPNIPNAEPPADQSSREAPQENWVEFTLFPDGRIDQVKGLDALLPEQQQAWQQWVSRFAAAAIFPANGVRPAQKWKSEEPEKSPAPITALIWARESTYVRNEPCRAVQMTAQGDFVESDQQPETCAVILTTATLKQQSSPKDTTPEDFRLRELRTMGTARGANSTITYISLKTGLVVRASEDASQAMDVTIAKADGSNRVHYGITAKSHSEVLLVTEAPPNHP